MLLLLCRRHRKNCSKHCRSGCTGRQLNLAVDLPDQAAIRDIELLSAAASGEPAAFELLYDRYERRVYNYARTFVREPALAEEVVIDTMLAVWRGARSFTQASRVSTWILGIARHKALDAVRKAGRQDDAVPLEQVAALADTAESPAEGIDRNLNAELVLRAIAQLSADHQEILRLAFYEELPYAEIAALLAIPDNTVKTRVFYAKQQLRGCLEKLDMGPA
jgi:RNA polymerase sigma-70 factor (ECF subfamily)